MNDRQVETEITIAASPEAVWDALTDPQKTRQYWYGALNHSTWEPGARWTSESDQGELYLEGEIFEADRPRRIVHTMSIVHESAAAAEEPSVLTIEIEAVAGGSRLRATNSNLGSATLEYVTGGWEHILGGLKSLLETGRVEAPAAM